jgi:hypothetical protein
MPVVARRGCRQYRTLFLSAGLSEQDEPMHHQLLVFKAYELGLTAPWETFIAVMPRI